MTMKQFFVIYLLPFVASFFITNYVALNPKINNYFFHDKSIKKEYNNDYRFIVHFNHDTFYEDDFLNSNATTENIFLLGSSELTHNTDAIAYNFISNRFDVKVKAVGHAGNQCLSILAQLLANQEKLNQAPIVIILSPSWFESKSTKGTPSAIFLEFNGERYLNKILNNKIDTRYKDYINQRVADMFHEYNSPNLELKLMYNQHQASKSFIHQALFKPVILIDKKLLAFRNLINPFKEQYHQPFHRNTITTKNININWDSLFATSKNQVLNNANNNHLGIANALYPEFENKTGHIQPVAQLFNQELNDMQVLIEFLKAKNANASFIISPLNPFYFKNLKELDPTIQEIEKCLTANRFKYLNLFESDTTKYDKALLFDVMHLSDFGWYKIDQFIIENYHLSHAN
jgi:D-alanyl-lipoteichoic acid biosynthesis protein DltD